MLELVEGKPAPMPLLAVQAFANTLDVETGTDLLTDVAGFQQWLERTDLIARGVKTDSRHLREARDLRDALRALLVANSEGTVDRDAALKLSSHPAWRRVGLEVSEGGRLDLDLSPAGDPRELVGQLLGVAFRAQLTGDWERLKLCQNPECLWAFYDSSRNRSGSWCRMGQCGNRLKNRAYRRRQTRA